jgi:hypothetical protein
MLFYRHSKITFGVRIPVECCVEVTGALTVIRHSQTITATEASYPERRGWRLRQAEEDPVLPR